MRTLEIPPDGVGASIVRYDPSLRAQEATDKQEEDSMDSPRIVVNHNKAFLDLMHDLLTQEGYEALCWHAADDTFARLQAARPALAILDIVVHQRDAAWALVERVHNDPTTAHIPVIVCTADVSYVRGRAPDLLKYEYAVVEKPFDTNDLLRQVRELLAAR
jgi:CheY-like chemotaxis protein